MNFEEYLISKKIDHQAFLKAEPQLYKGWRAEFEQMHPNSFTMQKLNLINPIRRKYQLKNLAPAVAPASQDATQKPTAPKIAKPVFKPKPKID